jgi:hypothetical protein
LAHCTPQNNLLITPNNPQGLSAFNLDSNLSGTAMTFGVVGIVHEAGGETANLSGIYTAEFVGLNPQQTLALVEAGSGSTYSANLSLTLGQTGAPEPTSIFLSGIGLVGLGLVSRVRRTWRQIRSLSLPQGSARTRESTRRDLLVLDTR